MWKERWKPRRASPGALVSSSAISLTGEISPAFYLKHFSHFPKSLWSHLEFSLNPLTYESSARHSTYWARVGEAPLLKALDKKSPTWKERGGYQLCLFFPLGFVSVQRYTHGFPSGSDGKESACNAGDSGLIPGSGRAPGEGNGYPLQYSCLETPTEEPDGLQSIGSQRVRHDWVTDTYLLT